MIVTKGVALSTALAALSTVKEGGVVGLLSQARSLPCRGEGHIRAFSCKLRTDSVRGVIEWVVTLERDSSLVAIRGQRNHFGRRGPRRCEIAPPSSPPSRHTQGKSSHGTPPEDQSQTRS